ncbi:MAG: zinc-ribbon domain containing protein [Planctomycetota bacterium]|nr:zinc-ribbon domain containing protein [Planctomycetota bacterium]
MPEGAPAQDKLLTCVDCGVQFVFTARDQAFYQERGYQTPRRCKPCRDKRKSGQQALPTGQGGFAHGNAPPAPVTAAPPAPAGDPSAPAPAGSPVAEPAAAAPAAPATGGGKPREQHKVTCSSCGAETTVPFKPDPNRPVYCRTCYLGRRKSGGSQM